MTSTVILSDNGVSSGSAGVKTTGGNDGTLLLQTTTSGGTATTAVTIDTSQNVGVGTSSPAISGVITAVNAKSTSSSGPAVIVAQSNDGACSVGLMGGNSTSDNPAITFQKSLRFGTVTDLGIGGFTERMRIDSSGNVGIGTSSPRAKMEVSGGALMAGASGGIVLYGRGDATYPSSGLGYFSLQTNNTDNVNGGISFYTLTSGTLSEKARIDTSGNLLVNSTSASASEKFGVYTTGAGATNVFLKNSNTAASGTYFLWGQANGTDKILWNTTGSVAIAAGQTYGNISDRKYKTNIVDTTPKLADVMRLKVRNFSTLSDPETKYVGWIAQEFQEVFPSLVFEFESKSEGDATETSLGVKESALTPILVKAIQEQQALITTLTERITALEAK
jgi:Chaperone of endosialidase